MTPAGPLRRFGIAAALFAGAIAAGAQEPPPERSSGWADKPPVASRRFMVAAAQPLSVDAGYAILLQGGSAVDAAIAVQLVLGLVEPQSSGLGGGAFMPVHDAKRGKLIAYDDRETAPAAAKPDHFLDSAGTPLAFYDAVIGGRSVGVPGVVALLAETHGKHGRLRWTSLFVPAIGLAENGFQVSGRLHAMVATDRYLDHPRARAFFSEAGRLAYADRAVYIADPEFFAPPAGLIDRNYLALRSRAIRTDVSMGRGKPGTPPARVTREKVALGEGAALAAPPRRICRS